MSKKNVIYQGAEAEICLSKYMEYRVVEKRRIKKRYRIKNIDDRLISSRSTFRFSKRSKDIALGILRA